MALRFRSALNETFRGNLHVPKPYPAATLLTPVRIRRRRLQVGRVGPYSRIPRAPRRPRRGTAVLLHPQAAGER